LVWRIDHSVRRVPARRSTYAEVVATSTSRRHAV